MTWSRMRSLPLQAWYIVVKGRCVVAAYICIHTETVMLCKHLHFTSLHFTSLHFTSLHFTSLHFTLLYFTLLYFTSPFLTSLYFTSPHLSSLHFITSLHSTKLHRVVETMVKRRVNGKLNLSLSLRVQRFVVGTQALTE